MNWRATLALVALLLPTGCGDSSSGGSGKRYDSFGITAVQTVATPEDANPEVVRLFPGGKRGVFVSAKQKSLTTFTYTAAGFAFDQTYFYEQDESSELSSITISPDGAWVAVTAIDQAGYDASNSVCNKGRILIVQSSDMSLKRSIEVGYNPDSAAFSSDGKWLVVANEDDREDRACKPETRHGGSVSIIDTSSGDPSQFAVSQELMVDHHADSEPEGVVIAPDNDTVLISLQETSEVGKLSLADVPNATLEVLTLPTATDPTGEKADGLAAEPDGLAVSPDGETLLVANERNGSFSLVSLADWTVTSTTEVGGDVPSDYNRDERKATKRTEPEECAIVVRSGKTYALLALQESHAVIVYNITDPAAPAFDSIAKSGDKWADDAEAGGKEKSQVGPEGLAVHSSYGIVFAANEREGSLTMMKASWSDDELAK